MSSDSNAAPPVKDASAQLDALVRRQPARIDEALELFDSLPPVRVEEMFGAWAGSGLGTGNPMDGVLEKVGWHGKRFDGVDAAHPLVMADARGTYSLNPALVPMGAIGAFRPLINVFGRGLPLVLRLMRTRKPRARLRMMEYRGIATATMSYDALPINDHFRRVDADTLLGLMDLRSMESPFFFVLRREG